MTDADSDESDHGVRRMGIGAAIALGAVIGLSLGIVVSVATDLPLAPEVGGASRPILAKDADRSNRWDSG
jgi:uncharacterized protein YqgC (DUF456 family)